MSPFCSVASGGESPCLVLSLGQAGWAFDLIAAKLWYMRGSLHTGKGVECPARQIRDPVKDLIVTCRDEATPLSVEALADGEPGVAAVVVFREFWWL